MTPPVRFALAATIALVLSVFTAGTFAPRAHAAAGVKFGLTDDAWLEDGSGALPARVAQLKQLGVKVVRITLNWNSIAATEPAAPTDPADPAYDWSATDPVLDELHSERIAVVLQLNGTPGWANGGLPPNYAPTSTHSFGDFATAAATHYPWVTRWLIWNEPNQARWLRPTKPAVYTTRLLNPAYTAIHTAIAGAQVAGGGTAPRGATGGVSPVAWIAGMHAAHARLDAYAHNPYPLNPKRESPFKGGCTHCTTITMATIQRLLTLVARDWKSARIWLTEYGYQSNPPDRVLGVPLALQALYISESDYVAYHTPRVDLLIHFLYRDEPTAARFQSGLVTLGGKPKPAYAAFELPLAVIMRSGERATLWGQLRAPAATSPAQIQRKAGTAWLTVATVRRGVGGFFRWTGRLPRRSLVRIQAGPVVGAPLFVR